MITTKKLVFLTPFFTIFFGVNWYSRTESQKLFLEPFQLPKNEWLIESPIQFILGYFLNIILKNPTLTYWIVVFCGYFFLLISFYLLEKNIKESIFLDVLFLTPFFLIMYFWMGKPDTYTIGSIIILILYNNRYQAFFLISLVLIFSHAQIALIYLFLIYYLKIFKLNIKHYFLFFIGYLMYFIYLSQYGEYQGRAEFIIENFERIIANVLTNPLIGAVSLFMWIWIPILNSEVFKLNKRYLTSFLIILVISLFSLDFTRTFLISSIPFLYKLSTDKTFVKSFNTIFSNNWIYLLGFLQLQKRPDGVISDSSWKLRFPEQFENIVSYLSEFFLNILEYLKVI